MSKATDKKDLDLAIAVFCEGIHIDKEEDRVFRGKVFVSLCSHSTGGCMSGSKRMGIETVVKNNGERIMKKL